ncbi:MAG TPA: hypothetical protein VKR22_11455, partial [Acidimicrobiales bacterium]|nr:hypothetical protein [Acidimicrobiales bacterium]
GRPVRVSAFAVKPSGAVVPLAGLRHARLRSGGMLVVGPNPAPPIGRVPVEVEADGPVVVELDPVPSGAPGAVVVPAWAVVAAPG